MDAWLTAARDALAAESGVSADELDLDAPTIATLLDLARIAAHESGKRSNAPLLCYLVGRAEREGVDARTLSDAVRAAVL